MKYFVIVACLLAAPALAKEGPKPFKVAATCFLTGENASGMNKICYYDCLGSPAAITVGAVSLCPLTINR